MKKRVPITTVQPGDVVLITRLYAPESPVEVTVLCFSPSLERVKLRGPTGSEYWLSKIDTEYVVVLEVLPPKEPK